jgi:hypothetical protein
MNDIEAHYHGIDQSNSSERSIFEDTAVNPRTEFNLDVTRLGKVLPITGLADYVYDMTDFD